MAIEHAWEATPAAMAISARKKRRSYATKGFLAGKM